MRVFTIFALAGLVSAAGIYAIKLGNAEAIIAWKSAVISFMKSWEANRLAQGHYPVWPWSHRARTSSDAVSPWNMLYHVGGNGPWIKKVDGTNGEDIEPPAECTVEQVHMVSKYRLKKVELREWSNRRVVE